MKERLNIQNLNCFWMYRDEDIENKVNEIKTLMQTTNQMIHKMLKLQGCTKTTDQNLMKLQANGQQCMHKLIQVVQKLNKL